MMTLTEPEDLQWLSDVHGIPTHGVKIAVLYGDEDCPTKVETFKRNSVHCTPTVYHYDETQQKLVKVD